MSEGEGLAADGGAGEEREEGRGLSDEGGRKGRERLGKRGVRRRTFARRRYCSALQEREGIGCSEGEE